MAKLFLVEDDERTLSWMTAALESIGHEVRGALGGNAALEVLSEWHPDLIIADILMPQMDGLTFARMVKKNEDVPLMFVSIAIKQAEAILLGAVGYVQKPATADEIRTAVTRVLGHPKAKNTILVAEDDEAMREFFSGALGPSFDVIQVANGREALERMRERKIDLAIVDVNMPIMNGIELIRAMRADPTLEKLPVIVETSDLTALRSPVWRDLHVAKVVDKRDFLDWLQTKIVQHVSGRTNKGTT